MNSEPLQPGGAIHQQAQRSGLSSKIRFFFLLAAALALVFIVPLYQLLRYSLESGSLYSHIILIPFVSGYFVWLQRQSLPEPEPGGVKLALAPAFIGAALLVAYVTARSFRVQLSQNDSLSFTIASFVCFFIAITLYSLGLPFCRRIAFPLVFLFFMVPFPEVVTTALESFSKHASAETYALLMDLCGASYFRQGLIFVLPGLTLEVAQECSGIRSSLVLFITSLIAGYMFLSRPLNRALLAFIVIPLGILRNAFRILTLSLLTIHWDPNVIHSPLHHRGGPLFFALSLVPFLLLLYWLTRLEKRDPSTPSTLKA